jgi:hypothetical protein
MCCTVVSCGGTCSAAFAWWNVFYCITWWNVFCCICVVECVILVYSGVCVVLLCHVVECVVLDDLVQRVVLHLCVECVLLWCHVVHCVLCCVCVVHYVVGRGVLHLCGRMCSAVVSCCGTCSTALRGGTWCAALVWWMVLYPWFRCPWFRSSTYILGSVRYFAYFTYFTYILCIWG